MTDTQKMTTTRDTRTYSGHSVDKGTEVFVLGSVCVDGVDFVRVALPGYTMDNSFLIRRDCLKKV